MANKTIKEIKWIHKNNLYRRSRKKERKRTNRKQIVRLKPDRINNSVRCNYGISSNKWVKSKRRETCHANPD